MTSIKSSSSCRKTGIIMFKIDTLTTHRRSSFASCGMKAMTDTVDRDPCREGTLALAVAVKRVCWVSCETELVWYEGKVGEKWP